MRNVKQFTDFREIASILSNSDFETLPFSKTHSTIADHLGFDASEIIAALSSVPLAMRGDDHQKSRKRMAEIIAAAEPAAKRFIDEDMPALLHNLLRPGLHNVIEEFILPCSEALIAANIGVTPNMPDDSVISRILSPSIGIAKRKRMNKEIAELRQALTRDMPDRNELEVNDRLALAILGTDALRGTLSQSLHAYFTEAPNSKDPSTPPRTGLPHIVREVTAERELFGQHCPVGSLVSADLVAFNDSAQSKERIRFFGFGAHTCLGRRMSLMLWRKIIETLEPAAVLPEVRSYKLRRDDVFAVAEEFIIEVA